MRTTCWTIFVGFIFLFVAQLVAAFSPEIEPVVLEKLQRQNYVEVKIELINNEGFDYQGLDRESRLYLLAKEKESIKMIQREVLSKLTNKDFRLKYRYKTINWLHGEISRSGLEKLKRNPHASKVILVKPSSARFLLAESVKQVGADRVRNIKVNNVAITGKGQTICLVDSGINYTHPNLGGCFGPGCKVKGGLI